MNISPKISLGAVAICAAASASAATLDSPTSGGTLPTGVSAIGGIVFDAIGLNNDRVVAQEAAGGLFDGNAPTTNPSPLIGTQTGFTSTILSALGGGIAELAIRVTLFDGDHRSGEFDFNDATLTLNGIEFGNFSSVSTFNTDGTGAVLSTSTGFGDGLLDTGFFFSDDATVLEDIYDSIVATGEIDYGVFDVDPGDQFYDFSQGIDASLINVGSGPVVTPVTPSPMTPVPLPAAGWMLLAGVGGLAAMRRRTKS